MKTCSVWVLLGIVLCLPTTVISGTQRKPAPKKPATKIEFKELPFDVRESLDSSTAVLSDLIKPGFNPIPVSVLNQSRCVVLINSKGAQNAPGIVSCRLTENKWTAPAFVSLHSDNQVSASRHRQLLILVMSSKSERALLAGRLKLSKTAGSVPGPLVTPGRQPRRDRIRATTFTYNGSPSQKLAPVILTGLLQMDFQTTRTVYGRTQSARHVLTGRTTMPAFATDYVTSVDTFFNMITPIGIIIHHSAALPNTNRVPTSEPQVDLFHRQRGFEITCNGHTYHVAYQYFILPDGKIDAGRPENCQGAHAHGYNAYIGISLAGDFSSVDNRHGEKGLTQPTRAQMRSLAKLCKDVIQRYHIPLKNVLRHSDVGRTRCPGDRFPYRAFIKGLSSVQKTG